MLDQLVEDASQKDFDCDYVYLHDGYPACECVWKKRIKWAVEQALKIKSGRAEDGNTR